MLDKIRSVSQSTFCNIWDEYCHHISTLKPKSDLCDLCRQNHLKLSKLSSLTVDQQRILINAFADHLKKADMQRENYNMWKEKSRTEFKQIFSLMKQIT